MEVAACMWKQYMDTGTRSQVPDPADSEDHFGLVCGVFWLQNWSEKVQKTSDFVWTKFRAKLSMLDTFWTKCDVLVADHNFGKPRLGLGLT